MQKLRKIIFFVPGSCIFIRIVHLLAALLRRMMSRASSMILSLAFEAYISFDFNPKTPTVGSQIHSRKIYLFRG